MLSNKYKLFYNKSLAPGSNGNKWILHNLKIRASSLLDEI